MLTLTGVSQIEEAQEYRNSDQTTNHSLVPDYVVDTIADFLPAFEELDEQSNWRVCCLLYRAQIASSAMLSL